MWRLWENIEEKSLDLHRKLVHRYTSKNLDYVPDHDLQFDCSKCNSKFLRKAELTRHKDTVHKERTIWKIIICPSCGTEFSRKDSYKRHLKKNICKNWYYKWLKIKSYSVEQFLNFLTTGGYSVATCGIHRGAFAPKNIISFLFRNSETV